MRILTIEPSMVTLLGVASRKGGTIFALDIFADIASRYDFGAWPKAEDMAGGLNKFEFKFGRFEGYQINSFEVYNDGVIISAGVDTDIIDRFLDDVLNYIGEKWGISLEKAHRVDRMYQSVVTFASDKDVLSPLNAAQSLMSDVREGVRRATGFDTQFAPAGLMLAVDEASIPSMKPSTFKIERRTGIEFKFNHYFSAAPLRTRDHIATLERWEASV